MRLALVKLDKPASSATVSDASVLRFQAASFDDEEPAGQPLLGRLCQDLHFNIL